LVRLLSADGVRVIALGRDRVKLDRLAAEIGGDVVVRQADLADPIPLAAALADARIVISTAHASFAPAILAALPAGRVRRLVLTGSTRVFSRYPDWTADQVRAAEAALAVSGIPGILLLPTLIYGPEVGSVVHGIAAQLRRQPFMPLPNGGKSLVQPVHVADVARALAAAARIDLLPAGPIVIAGPSPITYGEMVRAIGRAIGRPAVILPVPSVATDLAAAMLRRLPRGAAIAGAIQRLAEDKAFDVEPMRRALGVEPIDFAAGLATVFPPVS